MPIADLGDVALKYETVGPADGAPVVFAAALGTDLRIWAPVLPLLPAGLRLIRYDMRGHGGSSVPEGPYSMGALVRDTEALLDHLGVTDAAFVGLGLGGMVAQGLAVKRLDLIRALVLVNTAAKLGTKDIWARRIARVQSQGLEAIADETLDRWFAKGARATPAADACRTMLTEQPCAGYLGCAAAIAGTDFYTPTSGLRLPTLGIAGTADGITPPDLTRETVDLIPGSQMRLIRGAGHLPPVDRPEDFATALTGFLAATGHG
ncbi:3-oxoadipate enol-lactonase [Pseudodonghicola flavimaris]|uniref:3-oxoadipate enol-lactonase n=1 Tax=Pseudodonghicola flavimaris TaxID=3050036 RepID=A0ABT7EXW0_9RHOB|nr:3-oxoadipate enol-lactonase [Pseudodonghicola flavimaris]MDK3017185.1 3-oxoadipate enol-lactonase [Pseudodonghicola flavimaris]